jgi:hypothetical protein
MSGDSGDPPPEPDRGLLSKPASAAAQDETPSARTSLASRAGDAERCPECGTKRIGDDVYCEGCGYDFVNREGPATEARPAERWEAIVTADRDLFERGTWQGVQFPDDFSPVAVPLDTPELRIGRGELDGRLPDIDLEDPAVSRMHALLVRQEDGTYAVVDQGSSNGTTLNGDPTWLAAKVAVPLKHGDRVHVGAWTTIALHLVEPEES